MKTVVENKSFESQKMASADRIAATAQQAMPKIQSGLRAYLTGQGARLRSVELETGPTNTVDGVLTVSIKADLDKTFLDYTMDVPLKDGIAQVNETLLDTIFKAAKEADEKAPAVLDTTAASRKEIDLSQIEGIRHDELVVFTSKELPRWQYHVPVATLKDDNSRKITCSRIVASISGYCLQDFQQVAAYKQDVFALPMIHEASVTAKPEPMPVVDYPEAKIDAELTEHHFAVHGRKPAMDSANVQADVTERKEAFQSLVRRDADPAVAMFIRSQLKGGNHTILGYDYANVTYNDSGKLMGYVDVDVRYYSDKSIDQVTLRATYDAMGKMPTRTEDLLKATVAPTPESVKAAENAEAELKILSDEEASKEFEDYMEAQKKAEADGADFKVTAGYGQGSNFNNFPAAPRIPLLKALVPAELGEGDKLELRGFVYQLAATDYNCVDIEHSAYWMACLTDELPGKYPNMGMFG